MFEVKKTKKAKEMKELFTEIFMDCSQLHILFHNVH